MSDQWGKPVAMDGCGDRNVAYLFSANRSVRPVDNRAILCGRRRKFVFSLEVTY